MGEVLGSKIKNNRHADIIRFVKSQNTVSENTDFFFVNITRNYLLQRKLLNII